MQCVVKHASHASGRRNLIASCNPGAMDIDPLIQRHEVGPPSGSDPSELTLKSQEARRRQSCHREGVFKPDFHHRQAVSDGFVHGEIGSRQRAMLVGGLSCVNPINFKLRHYRPCLR